jgi:hypothetical protein
MTMVKQLFDASVIRNGETVIEKLLADVRAQLGNEAAVVAAAPAGAGKTSLVEQAVEESIPDVQVAITASTNSQVIDLGRRLSRRLEQSHPDERITMLFKSGMQAPADLAARPNVLVGDNADPNGSSVLIGTLDKLGSAMVRGSLDPRDLLLIDEAYQAKSSQYLMVGQLAPTHLLVGDPGQIEPFTALADGDYYKGLPEDPVQPAVTALLRFHPSTPVHRLPITRRLAPSAAGVATAFYPGHAFSPAVLPGVRKTKFLSNSRLGARAAVRAAVDHAAKKGWAYIDLPASVSLPAAPDLMEATRSAVDHLLRRQPVLRCERHRQWRPLEPQRIAVAAAHRDQVSMLQTMLATPRCSGVVIDTANRLQGLEFDFVVAVHPLAGLAEADGFHLDPGRLCVMLTRHRHGCIVIGRASDHTLLDGVAPATPAYLGCELDPVLDGWTIHRQVYRTLLGQGNRFLAS